MTKRNLDGVNLERRYSFDKSTIDIENRTIEGVSISSNAPVIHRLWNEDVPVVLSHEQGAIETNGIVRMLWNHNIDLPIGRIENIRIDNGKSRGKFIFSRNTKATEVFNDIVDGNLDETSVSAIPIDAVDDGDTLMVTRWMLKEGSVVTFGADSSVGIHRAKPNEEDSLMADTTEAGSEAVQNEVVNVQDFKINRERNLKDGEKRGVKEERKRISEVRRIFGPHLQRGSEYADLMDECIDKGVPISRSTDALLELLAGEHEPLAGEFTQDEQNGSLDRQTVRDVAPARAKRGEVTAGTTDMEKFMDGRRAGAAGQGRHHHRQGNHPLDSRKRVPFHEPVRAAARIPAARRRQGERRQAGYRRQGADS